MAAFVYDIVTAATTKWLGALIGIGAMDVNESELGDIDHMLLTVWRSIPGCTTGVPDA